MSELLSGISSFCGSQNLPGLKTLKYLPVDWIDQDAAEYEEFISTAYNFQKAIVPTLGGDAWLTMPFFAARGDGWEERQRIGEQGSEYGQEVSGIIPNLRPEVAGELEKMAGHLYLVHFTDRNDKNFLIGRLWEPLEFQANAETGSRNGGLSSYTFKFTGTTSKRAFGYVPVF